MSMGCRQLIFSFFVFGATFATAFSAPDYLSEIKPLFASRCFDCHGALRQKADLRLDTAVMMLEHQVIVAGKPEASALLHRISSSDPDEIMPPPHEGIPFTPAQIQLIREWIAAGAPRPADEKPETDPGKHWSFQPVKRPSLPDLKVSKSSSLHPIDRFVTQKHEELGLTPASDASRQELIRRVYLDFIGLPPSPEELETWMTSLEPDWYENLVDQLLEDPRHGERWARHWMDIWRYSDSWGLGEQLRHSQKHIWHWRDWIVESLNDNLGYDEMLRLMVAADESHPNDLSKLRASGFLARQFVLFNRNTWMDDTVEHVSKGMLGLTLNCAKCHDHKFDPLSQDDYYGMRAIFEPYLVRMDLVPGEADYESDGIPRACDALPEVPTYRYLRGDETTPDKSRIMVPAVPRILSFQPFDVHPVALPLEATQPERRPGVLESHVARAEKKTANAQSDFQKAIVAEQAARNQFSINRAGQTQSKPLTPFTLIDRFESLDPARWAMMGGQWTHQPGRLEQKKDGTTRSRLRFLGTTPRDFDAAIRFRITGGSQYRSVGIAFDTGPGEEGSSEQLLYASAGGSKVQAAYQDKGTWKYPGGSALHSLSIQPEVEYSLRLQVRDTLINASFNGVPVIAWRAPLPRREGSLDLITFDALAIFLEFTLTPLDPDFLLREPDAMPVTSESTQTTITQAEHQRILAEANLSVARAELASVRQRAEVMQAIWRGEDARGAEESALLAARQVELAKANRLLTENEQKLKNAATDKKESAAKEVEKARAALAKMREKMASPLGQEETFVPLEGARMTPTRFQNSGRDDRMPLSPTTSTGRRSALARWLTARENPLTARVAVNHIWLRHMGQAIVPTVFDFGRNGTPPTHPELLDWLAAELIDNGWNMRHLHRLIVTSHAYRMSSSRAGKGENLTRDPDNLGFWHRPPIRLESQAVRDSILSLTGELDATRGGPPVLPNQQEASKRRSLYFFHSNNERNLFLSQFDEARVAECYQREQSVVPQQALALSNSRLVLESAPKIAARLAAGNEIDDSTFVKKAFASLLAISPGEAEISASLRAMEEWRKLPDATPGSARSHLVWALLNHNDFVTLR